MVDFKKLLERTPEERKATRDKMNAAWEAKHTELEQLLELLEKAAGTAWEQEFTLSVRNQFHMYGTLTAKQKTVADRIVKQAGLEP